MPLTIPNVLTTLRVAAIPFVIWFHAKDMIFLSIGILFLSVLTDYFDGLLARQLNQETHFGAIWDPIADKFVALSYYTYLSLEEIVPWWFSGVIIARNFSQALSVPILIWWLKRSFDVRPKPFAKWATFFSDVFIFLPMIFAHRIFDANFASITYGFMIFIAFIELRILTTYLPRLVQIARGQHDTFE